MNLKQELFAAIDVTCFLEHIDDDWFQRFSYFEDGHLIKDQNRAFDYYTKHMEPQEFMAAVEESGCRI